MQSSPKLKEGLTHTEIGDELIVFDPSTETAHCLSALGKAVFLACLNGTLADEQSPAQQEALNELASKGLLQPETDSGLDRRKFLTAAATAAVAITASVVAPKPVAALSCKLCDLDASGFPVDCTTCGQPCVDSFPATCTGNQVCCYEFKRRVLNNPAPAGNGSLCLGTGQREAFGQYACRPVVANFNFDCNTQRALVADTALYYCCCCVGIVQTPGIVPANACC